MYTHNNNNNNKKQQYQLVNVKKSQVSAKLLITLVL